MIDVMIYIHIPFCDSKCLYCNFVSGIYDEYLKKQYFKKINEEIKFNANIDYHITSIYIGGGTPSSVDSKYILEILKNIFELYYVDKNAEITIETNPASLTSDKLLDYKRGKINRLSIGVQSLNNKCLKVIGRKHTKKMALKAITLAQKYGFHNINTDVLIGIPKQNFFVLKSTIKRLVKAKVTHISAYMLINEPNTPLTNMIESQKVKVVDEDKCVKYYNKIVMFLKKRDFKRYEVSNFAKNNYECKHNIGYWQCENYLGFGVSSHSYLLGERYYNTSNIKEYLQSDFVYNKNKLSVNEKIEEFIMLGLRTKYGINIEKLKKLGYDVLSRKKQEIVMLVKNGFIKISNGCLVVCEDKFGVLNQIILKLLP